MVCKFKDRNEIMKTESVKNIVSIECKEQNDKDKVKITYIKTK
ncbi:hypothetical protein [Clostridium pasteurianum]|nr:hypothetical protein [Clostridium pasteurianum]